MFLSTPGPFGAPCARTALTALAVLLLPAAAAAQQPASRDSSRARPAGADTLGRDSLPRLPEVAITVTSRDESLVQVPWSVGVARQRELRRAQPTVSFGEALTTIPGAYVAERYNYAVDSRISVRGFGNRANFGVRGVKILLDGIPQTLPDGQSQITNIELGALDRVEVLRGSAAALYGNGTGGVVAFESDMGGLSPAAARVRATAGSFGLVKLQAVATGRRGPAAGMLSLSRLTTDGFRQYSGAEVRQLNGGVDWALGTGTTARVRLALSHVPESANPGALTFEEYALRRDSASRNNVLRGSDKRVRQNQLGAIVRHVREDGLELVASAYGITRDVRNAIGVTPPGPVGPTNGTYATLDRASGGARVAASRGLWSGVTAPRLTIGAEWGRMRDLRQNQRATAGRPTAPEDTLLLNQVETVDALGPFAQLLWRPAPAWQLSAGARWDRTRFSVSDRFLSDDDQSGSRAQTAWSGHLGASYVVRPAFVPFANVSTAFETPTTTELQVRPDGLGGFNPALGPQRTLTYELGARGELGEGRLTYAVAGFRNRVSDLIVQFLETDGRAFFRNAGGATNTGVEVDLSARVAPRLRAVGAYTFARYRYDEYRLTRGAAVDTLDGNAFPGIPAHFARLGLRADLARGVTLDVDHLLSSSLYADDRNTLEVDGWGAGVTNVRTAWTGPIGRSIVTPFIGVQNVFDREYVSAVTVNGFGGRVLEPAPGRNWYVGVEIGARR